MRELAGWAAAAFAGSHAPPAGACTGSPPPPHTSSVGPPPRCMHAGRHPVHPPHVWARLGWVCGFGVGRVGGPAACWAGPCVSGGLGPRSAHGSCPQPRPTPLPPHSSPAPALPPGKGPWTGLNFMYEAVRVDPEEARQKRCQSFLHVRSPCSPVLPQPALSPRACTPTRGCRLAVWSGCAAAAGRAGQTPRSLSQTAPPPPPTHTHARAVLRCRGVSNGGDEL